MVILEVYTRHIKIKYKNTLVSKATALYVISGLFSIILPFVIAYRSGGYWLKQEVFYEQPNIRFKGDYIFMATTTNLSNPITCSSYSYYKHMLEFLDECSIIKAREIDDNFDGKVDKLTLSLSINLRNNMKLTSFNLLLPLDYKLNTVCLLEMESAIMYQQYMHQSLITDLTITSDLGLFQSSPISCTKKYVSNYHNNSIIKTYDDLNSFKLENIISGYLERNLSTHLTNVYTSFKMGNINKFTINLIVRYPEHKVDYKPGFWQIIKWAWIQYFATYIVVSWVINKIKKYIFKNRLVLCYVDCPMKKYK